MDAAKTCRFIASRAHWAKRLMFLVLCPVALLIPVNPAWANEAQGSASLDGGWVLLTVLAVLVTGLWLQSLRRRHF